MTVVVPMAGRGARFADSGVSTPKPFIPVLGRPMLSWALESLRGVEYSRIVFVALKEHEEAYGLRSLAQELAGDRAKIVLIPEVTQGQLCTVLAARRFLEQDPNEDVLITNSDTLVVSDLGVAIADRSRACRGIISVAAMPGDRWSFARVDETGGVIEVAEKRRISDQASTGLYYFAETGEFLGLADEILRNRETTRGEYYVIPVYQKLILLGERIEICPAQDVWDMGTPEALRQFASAHSWKP